MMRHEPPARGLRQSMSELHIWAGLLVGWILYAMFLTGSVSYFKEEISAWMRPELAHRSTPAEPAEVAARLVRQLQQLAPDSPQWGMTLPSPREGSARVFWRAEPRPGQRGFENASLDPLSGQKVQARDTLGGEFFYRFHFQFFYMPPLWGRWIAGFCAMFMLVAIVSGVITHKKIFVDFFTFRWGKGQRSWLDAHNALSVFGLPFHAMITYTGLVALMSLYMPFGEQAAFRTAPERSALMAQLTASIQPLRPSGVRAPLAPVEDMVRQAQQRWGEQGVRGLMVTNPGDALARVAVGRNENGRASASPQYLVFEGRSGRLLEVHDRVGAAAETRGLLLALHLGHFSDSVTRWLYFIVSLAGTAMVGTGLVMWTVKRRARLPDPERPYLGFRVVECLNIASIAGLSIAMTAFLWANRLLPAELGGRALWEVHLFFAVWAATLLHAALRPPRRAWIEQLALATGLLAWLPVQDMLAGTRPLWQSLAEGDAVFVGMDLCLWALAALHAGLLWGLLRHRPRPWPARGARPGPRGPLSQEPA